jgi:hypothetical protein
MSVQTVARSSTMNDILNTAPVGGMTAAGQFTSDDQARRRRVVAGVAVRGRRLLARLAPGLTQRMCIGFIARQRDMQSRSSVDLS